MEITVQELRKLKEESYQVIDIRSEADVSYGTMPGAICVSPDAIEENSLIDFSKKLVICCSRGKFSVEVAEELEKKGYDAVSLAGGYIAWLLDQMQKEQEEEEADFCSKVEESLRKKFRKNIWCRFTKAVAV